MKRSILLSTFLTLNINGAQNSIDVIFPSHEKDIRTLELAIKGARKNIESIRRIIVVSEKKITNNAEWFDEAKYPFTKKDVALLLFDQDEHKTKAYMENPENRIGWMYQQLLKLYAPLIIPDISSNVLVIDADTIFLNKTSFIDKQGYALYNVGTEHTQDYFNHMHRLTPGLSKVYKDHSGICHHMLLQRHVIEDLFQAIRNQHNQEPWQALINCIDPKQLFAGISEYEIYFNFAFFHNYKVKIRKLKWDNMLFDTKKILNLEQQGFNYVSCHSWL